MLIAHAGMAPVTTQPHEYHTPKIVDTTRLTIGDSALQPEQDTIKLNQEYVALLLQVWGDMQKDQEGRTATMKELSQVVAALRKLERDSGDAIDSAMYDQQIELDPRSPAAKRQVGDATIKTMSLWQLLLIYDLRQPDDAKPASRAALNTLIDLAEDRNVSMGSLAQSRQIDLNRVLSSREQAFLMNGNLIRQLMSILMSICKLM
jgi:hypothetical protein